MVPSQERRRQQPRGPMHTKRIPNLKNLYSTYIHPRGHPTFTPSPPGSEPSFAVTTRNLHASHTPQLRTQVGPPARRTQPTSSEEAPIPPSDWSNGPQPPSRLGAFQPGS
ncbi:hypothetical protein B0T16DRAFT_401826 [Cercophora newfieldiana]|uniref:Uncharacterized protein n=1 Tax=Cercophora newfieldiana TaxID=92897 RepID=A0AA39YU37_9PEZI|nr:hypothetical protein B0T16DRAFT_401826 [Cercophora newfieldiana]